MSLSIEEQLLADRKRIQVEVRAALMCRTKKEKLALVDRWRELYSPIHVQELLSVARNKEVAGDILAWDLENFKKRPKSSKQGAT
jgi:hypothetical protein